MKPFVFIFPILLIFTSCKKNTTVVIQAQNYLNTGDGSDYAGMKYAVVETWTPVYELKSKTVASGELDENGHTSFELKMKKNRKYDLGIETPDNVCYTEVTIQERLNNGENNNVTFNYLPCGYLSIPSKNINCEDSNDKFQMKYYYTATPDIYIYWIYA